MPRRPKLWSDSFGALVRLREFLAARTRAATRPIGSRLGRALRRVLRACGVWSSSPKVDDRRPEKPVLDLQPMDLRNPPTENIGSAALPLAATAAAAAATAYFVAGWQAREASASVAPERVGGFAPAPEAGVGPVALDRLNDALEPGGRGAEPAPPLEPGHGVDLDRPEPRKGDGLMARGIGDVEPKGGGGAGPVDSVLWTRGSAAAGDMGGGSSFATTELPAVNPSTVSGANGTTGSGAATASASTALLAAGSGTAPVTPSTAPTPTAPAPTPTAAPTAAASASGNPLLAVPPVPVSPPAAPPPATNATAADPSGAVTSTHFVPFSRTGGRPLPQPVIFVGSGATPVVNEYATDTGKLNFQITAFDPTQTPNGVNVATADFTRDGFPDVAVAPAGGAPIVRVFDGRTGAPLPGPLGDLTVFDSSVTSGVRLAAADVNGDGVPDLIAAAITPTGPEVRVFDGTDGQLISQFAVPSADFANGLSVAAADFTGTGKAEVAVGAGPGGAPIVRVYDPLTGQQVPGPLGEFRAFASGTNGVEVGTDAVAGSVDGSGLADIAVGSGPGSSPEAAVFSGTTGARLLDVTPFGAGYTGGVRVGLSYVNDDRFADLVVGSGPGSGAPAAVQVFDGRTGQQLPGATGAYQPFGDSTAGVSVAASNDPFITSFSLSMVPTTLPVGSTFSASMTAAFVSPSGETTFTVDWGDGTSTNQTVFSSPPTSPVLTAFSHAYAVAGTFTATATVDAYDASSPPVYQESATANATVVVTGPPPPAPSITGASNVNSYGLADNTTQTISGTATDYTTVGLYNAGVLIGTTTANGSGNWTKTLTSLADGTYNLTTTASIGGLTSAPSTTYKFIEDTTPPTVSLSLPGGTTTYDTAPPIVVTASDLYGVTGTVSLDADLNNNGNYTDPGETGFATGTISDGTVTFTGYPALTPGTTVKFRARVSDLAGNQGTSPDVTVTVPVSLTTSTLTSITSDTRSGYGGAYGWTTPASALVYAGDVTTSVRIAANISPADCGCQAAQLVSNSLEGSPTTTVQAVLQSNSALGVPTSATGVLTWDGTSGGTVTYDTSSLSAGSNWLFDAQPSSGLATGRHTYTLTLNVNYSNSANNFTRSVSGDTFVVDRSSSPYGAGWSFSNTDALVSIASSGSYPAGVLRLYGQGGWSFYQDTGGGTYSSPSGDAGTLTSSGGTWSYTASDGETRAFDSSGRMTNWTSADGAQTFGYTYTGSGSGTAAQVATMTSPDGSVATFAYSGGKLSSVAAPGSRTTSFTVSGGDLTSIVDPSGVTQTYAYSGHQMSEAIAGGATTSYTYSAGLVKTVQSGTDPVATISAAAGVALSKAQVTPSGSAGGASIDPRGKTTQTWFNTFGQPVQTLAPDGSQQSFTRDANGYITKSVDPLNRVTSYTVDGAGRVTQTVLPDGTTVTATYGGANGALTGVTDTRGGLWTYTNDAYGRQTTATDPLNHTTSYSYASGLLQTKTDPLGNVTTYLYDAARHPTGALVGGAPTGTIGYDSAGNANTFTDALGHTTTTAFDAAGRALTTTDPLGYVTTWSYDPSSGQLLSTTDPNGNVTSYGYDASGRVVTTIKGYGSGTSEQTTSVYDAAGDVIATIDPLGNTTSTVFDAMQRPVVTIDPLGNRTTSAFDPAGQLTATIDPLGRVTKYGFDAQGRQVTMTDALGNTTTSVYDASGDVVATIDPLGNTSTSVYDAAGQLTAKVDPLGHATSYGYDSAGRQITMTDPLGNVTSTSYDARGRVTATTDALGHATSYGYDSADNRITVTDPNGNVTTGVFDALNRQIGTIDALGNRSTSVYDAAGNVVATIDPLGHRTTGVFDALNRQIATIDALGNRSTSVYDADDRVVATVDPLGNRTTGVFDAAGRQIATIDALGNRTTSTFDAAGNVVASTDPLGNTTRSVYDGLNRLLTTTDPLGNVSSMSYDAAGRMVTTTDPNGNTTTSVFDAAGQQTGTIDALGNRSTSIYDAAGNVQVTIDPLGHRTTGVFDALNRQIATIDALNERSTILYDAAGNTLATIDPLGHRTTGVFDALNRQIGTIDALGNRSTSIYDAAGNVQVTIDQLGHRTTSTFDALNRVLTVTDALGGVTTTGYDAAGNVQTVTDPLNHTTSYGYDALNRQVSTTDPLGHVSSVSYDAAGHQVLTTDPLGHTSTSVFDAAGRHIATLDPLGNTSTSVYDAAGNVVATIDPNGNTTTGVFDALNRQIATIDALGNRSTSVFDAAGNVQVTIDQLGHRTTSSFDALNRVVTVTDALGNVTTTGYDAAGNVQTVTDPLNHTTSYGYDALNRRVTVTDPLSHTATTAYDAAGNVSTRTDPLGNTTSYGYDALNRRVTVTDPLGNTSTSVYDAASERTVSVDPLGDRTSYGYDAAGRQVTVTDPVGDVTTSSYDAAGNRIAVTDARGHTTTTSYDAANRVVSVTDPLNNISTNVYDAASNVVATIDQLGYRSTSVFDALNRAVVTIDPLGDRTTSTFDAAGNVKTVTDPLNHTTSYGYDALNRQVTVTDPLSQTTTSVFDAAGNRTVLIDADGNRTTSTFDAANRVLTKTDAVGTTTYSYDAVGRQTSTTDGLGRRTDTAYDANGRVLTEKWYATGGGFLQTLTYTYDSAGRMLTSQAPAGTYTMSHDAAGRVTVAQEPFGLTLTMSYDATGNRTLIQDSKNGVTTVSFDALNRQTSEQTAGTGVTAMRFDYAYTARGQVASETRYSDLAGTTVVGTTTHDYDAAGRQTHLLQKNGSGTTLAEYTYTYDAAGRMTAKDENGTTTSYSYDADGELTADGATTYSYDATGNRTNTGYTTAAGNQTTSDGVWSLTYDGDGNVTKRSKGALSDTWVYTYDNRNQMVSAAYSATNGGTVTQRVTYVYDAFGNRIEEDYWNGSTTTVTRFGMDGWNTAKPTPVANENFDTWADLDRSNNLTIRRAYGPAFDEVVARQDSGGTVSWYLTDIQGSVRLLTNNSGGVVGTLAYSAFGQVTTNSGATDRYQYTGREADSVLALQFNRGRIYDPNSGKWLSADPMGFAAHDANLYRYVGNQVTTKTDPSGLEYIIAKSGKGADAIVAAMNEKGVTVEKTQLPDGTYKLKAIGAGVGDTIDKLMKADSDENKPKTDQNLFYRHVLLALRPSEGKPNTVNYIFAGDGKLFAGQFSQITIQPPLFSLEGLVSAAASVAECALLGQAAAQVAAITVAELTKPRVIVKEVRQPALGKQGLFVWGVTFELTNPAGKGGGWIVQHVVVKRSGSARFAPNITDRTDDYWEAWRVNEGKDSPDNRQPLSKAGDFIGQIFNTPNSGLSTALITDLSKTKADDVFAEPKVQPVTVPHPLDEGKQILINSGELTKTGTIYYFDGLEKLPDGWKAPNVKEAGQLPSIVTKGNEKAISDFIAGATSGPFTHSITVKWGPGKGLVVGDTELVTKTP
jgi:RHS repeat-associated protein